MSVLLETSDGDLVIDLDTQNSPTCCKNFVKLCQKKYYNFSPFYNVYKNFTAQSGDPQWPLGTGGESIWGGTFTAEERDDKLVKGDVAMALQGKHQAGSQFVVVLSDEVADSLHGKVTVFGRVVEGEEVIDKLNNCYCDDKNRPLRDVRIKHTHVLEDPYAQDEPQIGEDVASPEPTEAQLSTIRLGDGDKLEEELDEDEREKRQGDATARAQALTLEMMGDLPFAEVKPQENVLFVCKLNPLTNDEDLELIFSRFGKILSCEIIKDPKTGDSLQYAFIEFEEKSACERAYYGMDSKLVDDRRIHVDFSQSVSRLSSSWRSRQNTMRQNKHGDKFQPRRAVRDDPRRESHHPRHHRQGRDRHRHKSSSSSSRSHRRRSRSRSPR